MARGGQWLTVPKDILSPAVRKHEVSRTLNGTQAGLDPSRRAMAIPDQQALPFLVPEVGIPPEVVFDLYPQGLRPQPLRSIKENLAW